MRWQNPIPLLVACATMLCASAWSTETSSPATITINGDSWINTSDMTQKWSLVGNGIYDPFYYAVNLAIISNDCKTDAPAPAKTGHYRLWSQVVIQAQVDSSGVLSAVVKSTDKDPGAEADGLLHGTIFLTPAAGSMLQKQSDGSYSFSYTCYGAPNILANIGLDLVKLRTSVNIWHTVTGTISVPPSGSPGAGGNEPPQINYSFSLSNSSTFPMANIYVNQVQTGFWFQTYFTDLWRPLATNPKWVIQQQQDGAGQ